MKEPSVSREGKKPHTTQRAEKYGSDLSQLGKSSIGSTKKELKGVGFSAVKEVSTASRFNGSDGKEVKCAEREGNRSRQKCRTKEDAQKGKRKGSEAHGHVNLL